MQLEEYKDAFRIFDRHGQGSFTGTDVEWVMRSLGQTPTPKQIEAIIRDMDLDNDGVIDLAEFMIRMMALTTKVSLVAIHTQAYCETFHNGSQLFGECCDCLKMPKEFRPQAAPEEDLKHVFDVLDRGSNGQITADALRSAIKVRLCDVLHMP